MHGSVDLATFTQRSDSAVGAVIPEPILLILVCGFGMLLGPYHSRPGPVETEECFGGEKVYGPVEVVLKQHPPRTSLSVFVVSNDSMRSRVPGQ